MVDDWSETAHRFFLPWTCLCCGAPGQDGLDLCIACRRELPWNLHACARCALPLPAAAPVGARCGACLRNPPPFDAAFAPFRYAFPVDRLLVGLKFAARLERGRLLGDLFARCLDPRLAASPRPLAILPMPLHPSRLATRGFNQAAELARPIARRLGLPLLHDPVRRTRATAEQTKLAAGARRRNLRGAFAVCGALPERIAVFDDVVTTGATASELARSLKRAGVASVVVWSVARAS